MTATRSYPSGAKTFVVPFLAPMQEDASQRRLNRPVTFSTVILDRRVLQSTPESRHWTGYDGGKWRKCSKAHSDVDTRYVHSPRVCGCIFWAGISHESIGQVLHGSARTTSAIRAAIQCSQESLQTLANLHVINTKTVAKWRKHPTTTAAPMGPTPVSTVLTVEQEPIVVASRKHTLLPLDDCLYALQATIPHLSRSALHRCFQRHGISRLLLSEDRQSPPKKKFKDYSIGYLHVDFAEVQTEEGRQYLFVAIDRTSKVAFAELHPRAKRVVAAEFLRRVLDELPCRVHTVLTDNGVQFTPQPRQFLPGGHSFDRICHEYGVEHRLTKPAHPWTNG